AVGAPPFHRIMGGARADIDDHARPPLDKMRQDSARSVVYAEQIDRNIFRPRARITAGKRADRRDDTGVVDDRIDPAIPLQRLADELLDRRIVGNIAACGKGIAAGVPDLFKNAAAGRSRARAEAESRPACRERERRRGAYPAARAGNDDGLIFEFLHENYPVVIGSERGVRLRQKGCFLRRRLASELLISMREATKALDNEIVFLGIIKSNRVANFAKEVDGELLILDILAMLERQGRELFLECAERVVKAGFDHVPGNLARLAVRRESPRGIAKHIARELIEQENEGKRALRALGPVEIFARRRLFKIRKEAVANF